MLTLQALLGTLPSARLAEADLPRFLTQALGRMSNDQLRSSAALLKDEQLVGYPRALAPLMHLVIEALLVSPPEAGTLEPSAFERLLANPNFLVKLDRAIGIEHVVLRPGEVVSPDMRDLVGRHLKVLPGIGPHLTMVAPTEVACLPGLGHCVVRSPVLARPMSSEEAELMQSNWATIEEVSGWPESLGREWEARFVRISTRTNLPASVCVERLSEMQAARRRALWLSLVGHQRLLELPETHRPGLAALNRRLDALSLEEVERERVPALLELVRTAYLGCALNVGSREGDYPVTPEDVDAYIEWVEHPNGAKSVLASKSAEQLQRLLRLMTAVDKGVLQDELDADEVRQLRLFRDQYLAAVYRRDLTPLMGVDPLFLAQHYVAEGSDKDVIISSLNELAQDAQRLREMSMESAVDEPPPLPEEPESLLPEAHLAPSPFASLVPRTPKGPTTSPGVNPFAPSDDAETPHRIPTSTPPMKLPPLPAVPPARARRRSTSSHALPPLPERPTRPRSSRPRTRPRTQPFPDLEAMPLPTPMSEPRRQERQELSQEPTPSSATPPVAEVESEESEEKQAPDVNLNGEHEGQEGALIEEVEAVSSLAEPEEVRAEGTQAELDFEPASSTENSEDGGTQELMPEGTGQLSMKRSKGRLVTPGQAARFYAEAFRELQVLERDLLERGTWPLARRRVEALSEEATELALSLGPPARSGDADFQTALRKVELVQSYLERIAPLMVATPPAPPEPEATGMLDRLSGMFKRDDGEL